MAIRRCALSLLPVLLCGGLASAEPHRFEIDPASSQIVVHVGKAGLFRFAGHEHEVVAPVQHGAGVVDPDHIESSSLELIIDATTLRVTGPSEPPNDLPKVQGAMVGPKCLDTGRFDRIRFRSSAVSGKRIVQGALDLVLTGILTLHGVSREVVIPVHVVLGTRSLTAMGTTTLRQSDFGITPISVAGVVKVKDELVIDWHLVGRWAR